MTSNDDPFYAAIAQVRDAVASLIAATELTEPKLPHVDSEAMRELSEESAFAGAWGGEPIVHAHVLGAWKRGLAVDCAESLIRDLQEDPAPVYAYTVLSRAVLENAASSARLLEPGIGTMMRIARGRNERIFSAQQKLRMEWLPESIRHDARDEIREIKEFGMALGFSVTEHGWLQEHRLSFTSLLRWLLGEGLGGTLANYYSAVAHGTQYGLASAVIAVEPPSPLRGVGRAAVGPSSNDVNLALSAAGMGLIRCLDNERRLMGHHWGRWDEAQRKALDGFEEAFGRALGP